MNGPDQPVRLFAAALVVVVAFVGSLCPAPGLDGGACTAIGCESSVSFELRRGPPVGQRLHAKACLDSDCVPVAGVLDLDGSRCIDGHADDGPEDITVCMRAEDMTPTEATLTLAEAQLPGEYLATLVIESRGDVVVDLRQHVSFRKVEPNGPECGPVCWQAVVEERRSGVGGRTGRS